MPNLLNMIYTLLSTFATIELLNLLYKCIASLSANIMVVGKCDKYMTGVIIPTLNTKPFKRQIILQKYELESFLNVGADNKN